MNTNQQFQAWEKAPLREFDGGTVRLEGQNVLCDVVLPFNGKFALLLPIHGIDGAPFEPVCFEVADGDQIVERYMYAVPGRKGKRV